MTRKEFWKWMALCPAHEGLEEAGCFVVEEDGGTEVRVAFYLDIEEGDGFIISGEEADDEND